MRCGCLGGECAGRLGDVMHVIAREWAERGPKNAVLQPSQFRTSGMRQAHNPGIVELLNGGETVRW